MNFLRLFQMYRRPFLMFLNPSSTWLRSFLTSSKHLRCIWDTSCSLKHLTDLFPACPYYFENFWIIWDDSWCMWDTFFSVLASSWQVWESSRRQFLLYSRMWPLRGGRTEPNQSSGRDTKRGTDLRRPVANLLTVALMALCELFQGPPIHTQSSNYLPLFLSKPVKGMTGMVSLFVWNTVLLFPSRPMPTLHPQF